jgi:SAM-dependent methyltransferase
MKWPRRLFFTLWYFRDPPWDTNITPPELVDFMNHHSPGRAIDLGCGTGTNVIALAQHHWRVVGVDYVRKAIRTARRKARQANVQAEFRVGDVTDMGWVTQPFDLVLDIGCLHSLDASSRQRYIQNLKNILSPGGIFLLYAFVKGSDPTSTGLTDADLDMIALDFDLVAREDGMDRDRVSSWFTYQRSMPPQEES